MEIKTLMVIVIASIFINNFVFARYLGICPYIGVSKQIDSALGMGMAVIFVMTIASMATWTVYTFFLEPTPANVFYKLLANSQGEMIDLTFLRTIAFILIIASLVQFVEMVIQKVSPNLYQSLGIFLPLITTNCAILGVAVLNIDEKLNFIQSVIQGFASGVGFTIAIVLMAGIREKLDLAKIPEPLKGIPIAMIMAGLMAIAFLGFSGLTI